MSGALQRVRALSLSLPEVNERLSHGSPTFFIRDHKTFVMYLHRGRVCVHRAEVARRYGAGARS